MALKLAKSAIIFAPLLIVSPSVSAEDVRNIVEYANLPTKEVSIADKTNLYSEITNEVRIALLGENEINFFIAKHRDLESLLEEAKKHIANIFPEKTTLVLEMFRFTDEEQDILSVKIENNDANYDEMAYYLDQFNEKWWIPNIQKAQQRLTFEV